MTPDDTRKMVLKLFLSGETSAAALIKDGKGIGTSGFGLYAVLRDLLSMRLLQSREVPDVKTRRPVVMYQLTDTGRLQALGAEAK